MSIDGVSCRRKTEDLVDDWAHDAGIVANDEHIKARSGSKSSAKAWEERHDVSGGDVAEAGIHMGVEVAPEIITHVHLGGAAAVLGVTGCVLASAGLLYKGAWADAHAKGDGIRELAHNDAVNVAIARRLDFAPAFKAYETASRPGVEKNTDKLLSALDGKDKALVPILQARADEGFIAQKRAFEATKALGNTPERAEAMQRWMKDNGFGDRQRSDVAFGKGAEYFMWLRTVPAAAGGIELTKTETAKVEQRTKPDQAFVCRG